MENMLAYALSFYGVKEIAGENHNPQIVKFFHDLGFNQINDDETAWCSAIMNWWAKHTGYEYTGLLNARSWLSIGTPIMEPKTGDVVIFWRNGKASPYGHVGHFINKYGSYINCLGGNQSDRVDISPYPAQRVLGYRRLKKKE